ncbi:hypothetical protein PsYK624_165730 [Phanerochaete sordida]|uniref:Uncharacterized protein n=1 Tax=Phanerochaete sordida TaxID=48140 RepID=A0A9P3LLZ9_9APHY|nr:hypothetical protein PsYK624_165730 [Phanerochaete sordida]
MSSSPKSLLDLPNELLWMIKDAVGEHLLGNACFYLLCTRTSAFYHTTSAADWQRVLRANGLGLATYEYVDESEYEHIAFACAHHAWACTHPHCGRARLEENYRLMGEATAAWPTLRGDGAAGTVRSPHFDVAPDEGALVPSTLFAHIAFRAPARTRAARAHTQQLAYLRPAGQDARQRVPGETLDAHPVALRTFASFPPLEAMNVDAPFEVPRMLNRTGLTARDVCRYLSSCLDQKVYPDTLKDALRELGDDAAKGISWDANTVQECVKQMRDWFQVVRWTGFEYQRRERNRWFMLKFEPRALPASAKDVEGLCSPDPAADEETESDAAHLRVSLRQGVSF